MKEADESGEEDEQDESGEEEEEENSNCEENGSDKPAVKRDGTMVVTASVRLSTIFSRSYLWLAVWRFFR